MKAISPLIFTVIFSFLLSFTGSAQINTEQRTEDAELLWKALNELHPGLYRHADTSFLEAQYNDLLTFFSVPRSDEETFLRLSHFTAQIKCGHTYVNPFNQRNSIVSSIYEKRTLLPFTFQICERQMLVKESFTEQIASGDVITSLNDVPISKILDSLTDYIKADGNREAKRLKDLEVTGLSKFEYFDYFYSMIFNVDGSVSVRSKNDNSTRTIELLSQEERSKIIQEKFPEISGKNYDHLWSYQINDDASAYLKLGTFVTWRLSFDWKDYLDDFFDLLKEQGIEKLIIDVRGNEGGLTDVTDHLIKKLASHKGKTVARIPHLRYKNVSDEVKPHVTTWSKWFYKTGIWTKKLDETYRTIKFTKKKAKKIRGSKKAFLGDAVLLVNESNSSATFILSEICRINAYTHLIGSETGGTKKGITAGQIFFLTLPNSNIEIDIPLIGQYPIEDLEDRGIIPDIVVHQTIEELQLNVDSQLEAAWIYLENE